MSRRPRLAGFSLIEMLLVLAFIAILAAIAMPSMEPAVVDQLRATARIVAADLAYARSLAVGNNSTYRITFDLSKNRYVLQHSGTNGALDALPKSPFSSPGDPADRHIVALDDLPHVGSPVQLAGVLSGAAALGNVEFGPLGQTINVQPTTIWLRAGRGDQARYISLEVNPVTGMVSIADCSKNAPSQLSSASSANLSATP